MRYALLLVLLLPATFGHSQAYQLFPDPSDTLPFKNADGIISHVHLDSINISPTKTTYYPMGEYVENLSDGCQGRVNFDGWLGRSITDSAGHLHFKGQEYELHFDVAQSTTSPQPAGWLKRYQLIYHLKVNFDSVSYSTLHHGQQDTVRHFTLSALDTAGRKPTDPGSNEALQIAISKNHGLVSFPYLPANRSQFGYSTNLKRTAYDGLLRKAIYDFQIHDEFHYSASSQSYASGGFPRLVYGLLSKFILLSRHDFQDSVYYRWQETWMRVKPSFGPDTTYGVDTIGIGYDSLSYLAPAALSYTGEIHNHPPGGPYYHYWDTDVLNQRPGYYRNLSTFEFDSTGCFWTFEPSFFESWYARGLGETKSKIWRGGFAQEINKELVYFKKGNESWGTPLQGIGLDDRPVVSLKVYPNPASDYLILEGIAKNATSPISITDMSGRVLVSSYASPAHPRIDISALPGGIYVLLTKWGAIQLMVE